MLSLNRINETNLPIDVCAILFGVPLETGSPNNVKWVVWVLVLGPANTKLVKSSLSWQIFSVTRQTSASHLPVKAAASPTDLVKCVMFSLLLPPQFNSTKKENENSSFVSNLIPSFMWSACHKESYLICNEITNFWNII